MYRLCVLYKFIHLINKPGLKKNIIWIEFTVSLYYPCILSYNTSLYNIHEISNNNHIPIELFITNNIQYNNLVITII